MRLKCICILCTPTSNLQSTRQESVRDVFSDNYLYKWISLFHRRFKRCRVLRNNINHITYNTPDTRWVYATQVVISFMVLRREEKSRSGQVILLFFNNVSKPGELRVSVRFHSIITSGKPMVGKAREREREKNKINNNMFRHSFRRENRGGADAMSLGAGKRSGPPSLYDLSTSFGTFPPLVYHHDRSLNLQHTPHHIPAPTPAIVSFGFSIYHSTSVCIIHKDVLFLLRNFTFRAQCMHTAHGCLLYRCV